MSNQFTSSTDSNMTCDHLANDSIEAVAFGFASPEEEQLVLEHVVNCEVCAEAFAHARNAAQALPLSLDEMDVPDSLWAGIEQRITQTAPEANTTLASPEPTPGVVRNRFQFHWAAVAMLAVLTLAAGILLGRTVFEPTPDAPVVQVVEVSFTDPQVDASGTVHYFADRGVVLLNLENFPSAPDGLVYQVWMIQGETPVSMGVISPDSSQFATSGDPSGFDLLAITLEEGPRGNDQPTSDPIAIADLAQLSDE